MATRRTTARFLAGTAAIICLAQGAVAQEQATETAAAEADAAQAEDPGEEIIVTGSRISAPGLKSPTPLTATSAEQLQLAAPSTIAAGLNQLPQFRSSARPEAGGTNGNTAAGANQLNLRSLGVNRNLVLLDGRRIVPSSVNYVVDINTLPESLMKRVDVVTGGASAAYGSDAVAGVVNFILDDRFEGLTAKAQAGISDIGDAHSQKVSLTFGQPVGERGHFIAAVDYYRNSDLGPDDLDRRGWSNRNAALIPNVPATARPSRLLVDDNVFITNATFGGLVTSGPLMGTAFGPGGVTTPFTYGTTASTTFQVGGTGGVRQDLNLTAGTERWTSFGRYTHDIGDTTSIFAEVSAGQSEARFDSFYNQNYAANNFTIFRDNAFLPADVLARMVAANVQSISIGRIHTEAPYVQPHSRVRLIRGATGIDGEFGEGFKYNAYYSHGETRTFVETLNVTNYGRIFAAVDAVRDASGNIVCRVTTLNSNFPGCVPFNPFGQGSPSQAAVDYNFGDQSRQLTVKQDVAALNLEGSLFSLTSTPVTFATGVEYRRETARQTVSASVQTVIDNTGVRGAPANLQGQVGPFAVGNPKPQSGKVNVKEAYVEVLAPLVEDVALINSLQLNGALRLTDYSTSGSVTTWKVGAVYEPIPEIRFRGTRSRDIRAPTIGELGSGTIQSQSTIRDPRFGNATFPFFGLASGNPNLDPEKADTWTVGVVVQPTPRLTFSADYYDIKIEDAIGSLTAQLTVDECSRGSTVACNNITVVGGSYRILLPLLNLNELKVTGLDLEANYRAPLGDGNLTLRALANYQGKLETTTPGSVPINRAGEVGTTVGVGNPKWLGTLSATYEQGPGSGFVQARYLGKGKQNTLFVEGTDIDDNSVPSVVYVDASVSYRLPVADERIRLFGTVNNLFNKAPPLVPITTAVGVVNTNTTLYDAIGRYITVGAEVKF